jgi:hypothetical protein
MNLSERELLSIVSDLGINAKDINLETDAVAFELYNLKAPFDVSLAALD